MNIFHCSSARNRFRFLQKVALFLDPIPYEAPEEVHADEIEVVDEEIVEDTQEESEDSEDKSSSNGEPKDLNFDDEGQITLF